MATLRPAAVAAPALIALLALAGCAPAAPQATAPPVATAPATTSASPTPIGTPAQEEPSSSPTEASGVAVPADWQRFDLGDGHTSWSMPADWTADITTEVIEGRADWTDHRGLVRDAAGIPMLRFEAVGSGGQYATDFSPCERPEAEVLESLPLGEHVVDPGAAAVAVAYAGDDGRVVFAAGVSENDAEGACEPGILALYQEDGPAGYDYLLLQIVADDGLAYPSFASFEAARAYLETDEYGDIRTVLASFASR
ncbi:hypothetical protein [Agrococcus carbonis]|uniref:Uncharacterized protein n=1 Tax=Agrococcus carbonis TaxID=684552 RepID=A0A1H1QC51_9MICO|nr:hypothetical protein [Agrococcus carbonis]SDS21072.1 hypothetical protein SAMN04489719_1799 [Agrococcus carbonis]